MALTNEIARGWDEHGTDPEAVARQCDEWIARAEPADVPSLVNLLIHLYIDHLGEMEQARASLERLSARTLPADTLPIQRALAMLSLVSDGDEGMTEDLLSTLGEPRFNNTHRAWVFAMAAGSVGARGRPADAMRWLVRAANLTYSLPEDDPSVRTLAVVGNNLACALEEKILAEETLDLTSDAVNLLRLAASVARVAWERSGTWLEVERAEYRLAIASLAVREPFGAAAHAEICRLICEMNAAPPTELAYAYEALARSRYALGDVPGAKAARDFLLALPRTEPAIFESLLARLDALFAEPDDPTAEVPQ